MKKVDIVTYCEWNSYGSILQAWALKHYLNSYGCQVNHIRLNTISSNNLRLYFKGRRIKTLLININRFFVRRKLQRRFDLTQQFFSDNFNFITYVDYDQLKLLPPHADVYVAGSDQIWNPNAMSPFFYLEFVDSLDKRISYAASMGVSKIPEDRKFAWHKAVQSFKTISVREKDVAQIISSEADTNVMIHVDPTFLIDKNVWTSISKGYPIKSPYILVYALFWNKEYNGKLKILHKKTGLPIVAITSQLQNVYAHKKIYDASICEFLWLFDNASYIITSSFHGAVFSIIFEKKFSTIINPQKPSRLKELLDTFEIENIDIDKLSENNGPNYERVKEIILNERAKSYEYLRKEIGFE